MRLFVKNTSRISILCMVVLALSLLANSAVAQSSEEKKSTKKTRRSSRSLTREDSSLLSVFKPLALSASESTVKIQSGYSQIAVGTVVSSDGLILTKASEMRGEIKCRLPNGDVKPAKVEAIDVENDLALLKIDAEGLAVADLKPVAPPTRGMWLASPTDQLGSLTVGVVGVEERKIPPSRAFIGILMEDKRNNGGVVITEVFENTPAKTAKLREGDIIQKIDQFEVGNRFELVEAIGKYTPGSEVELIIERDKKEMVFRITLGDAKVTSPMNSRSRTQNRMGSMLSRRGTNFPRAFQHDMALEAKHCGSPVVNLDGQIVGINVARSGRVSSLAIPVDVVLSVIDRLKSGEFSPVKVNADRIESTNRELAKLEGNYAENKKSVEENLESYDACTAKIEELERMKKEIANRIKEVYEERAKSSRDRRVIESKNKAVDLKIQSLKKRLDALKSGTRPGF